MNLEPEDLTYRGVVHFKLASSISSYWGYGFTGGVVVVAVVLEG